MHVTDDPTAIVEAIAGSFGVDRDDAHDGARDARRQRVARSSTLLERRRERWQMSYVVVPDDAIDACAPVVARLAGT